MSNKFVLNAKKNPVVTRFEKKSFYNASNKKNFFVYEKKEQTNEKKFDRRLAALDALYNSTADEEEPEATAKFFEIMDEQKKRKAAAW